MGETETREHVIRRFINTKGTSLFVAYTEDVLIHPSKAQFEAGALRYWRDSMGRNTHIKDLPLRTNVAENKTFYMLTLADKTQCTLFVDCKGAKDFSTHFFQNEEPYSESYKRCQTTLKTIEEHSIQRTVIGYDS